MFVTRRIATRFILVYSKAIVNSKNPIIWAGGGVISSEASKELTELANYLQAPVITTGEGRGAISDKNYLSMGSFRFKNDTFFENEINDFDINDKSCDVVRLREKIGMVFQKPNPFPKTIYENISYGPTIHGMAQSKNEMDEIVETSLKKAALWEEVKDRLHEPGTGLSGGQQQRLCIARAISVKPEVILMDEPCSALDPIATAQIEELIDELKKDHTIIIVTHSMAQAARVSQNTGFFHLGELIEHGSTDKIFKNPENKKTQDYITGRFG